MERQSKDTERCGIDTVSPEQVQWMSAWWIVSINQCSPVKHDEWEYDGVLNIQDDKNFIAVEVSFLVSIVKTPITKLPINHLVFDLKFLKELIVTSEKEKKFN